MQIGRAEVSREEFLNIIAFVLLGLVLRLALLIAMDFGIESDEAIVGLMAKHILDGEPWPVFYYGQAYMGSLEALLTALVFGIFGISNATLKVVPVVFSLFHIVLVYVLARRFLGRFGASVSSLLTAVGPSALILWSTKTRGGFIELVVLGTLSLILAVDVLRQEAPRKARLLFLAFVLGVGWWVNNQIIFYMAGIGLAFLIFYPLRFGFWRSLLDLILCCAAFFVGSAPFWYVNLFEDPQWASFSVLFGESGGQGFAAHLCGFFSDALPIITGARRFWSDTDVFPGASLLLLGVYLTILLLLGGVFVQPRKLTRASAAKLGPVVLIILFFIFVPVIFSLSSFGWLSRAPRYLLPLYSVLFLPVGAVSEALWSRSRVLGIFFPLMLLIVHFISNFDGKIVIPGQPFIFRGERVSADHSELYRWLDEYEVRHIWTNYWIGYRVAFETGEKVTFTRFGRPRSLRIKRYENKRERGNYSGVYVLAPSEALLLKNELDAFGYRYQIAQASSYTILYDARPKTCVGRQIPFDYSKITASSRSDWLKFMFDDDPGTRWGSGEPQSVGMYVELAFSLPEDLSSVEIELGEFRHDAPRGLVVEVQGEGSSQWLPVLDTHGTKIEDDMRESEFSEIPERWRAYFSARAVRKLRLRLTSSAPIFDWSITEVKAFAPCR